MKVQQESEYLEQYQLIIYSQDKTGAQTNKGFWSFSKCLACFLGMHNRCLGSCICE